MESAAHEIAQGVPIAVLLVDDEQNVLKALRRLLIDEDCEVFTATSGREGLEILKEKENVGVIISDQRMPEMTGVDFLEQARKVAPYAMKIMLTGYADVHATADAINKGRAHRYMTKPWDDDEILDVVRSAVDTYRLILNNRRQEEAEKEEQKNIQGLNLQLEKLVKYQQNELKRKDEKLKEFLQAEATPGRTTVLPILDLLESRSGVDQGHGRFVATIATELCREIGYSPDELETITTASLLHDLGKISSPDSVLAKSPDEMSREELMEYQLHPTRGQRALDEMDGMAGVGTLVRHHHEAFDGTGFPDRLKGTGIPLGSRIIALADFVSRFVPILDKENASERILQAVEQRFGTQYDPKLQPYLVNLLRDETSRRSLAHPRYVKELDPEDLIEGMELAMDIRSDAGVLLLKRGTIMNSGSLLAFEKYCRQENEKPLVFVYFPYDRVTTSDESKGPQ